MRRSVNPEEEFGHAMNQAIRHVAAVEAALNDGVGPCVVDQVQCAVDFPPDLPPGEQLAFAKRVLDIDKREARVAVFYSEQVAASWWPGFLPAAGIGIAGRSELRWYDMRPVRLDLARMTEVSGPEGLTLIFGRHGEDGAIAWIRTGWKRRS